MTAANTQAYVVQKTAFRNPHFFHCQYHAKASSDWSNTQEQVPISQLPYTGSEYAIGVVSCKSLPDKRSVLADLLCMYTVIRFCYMESLTAYSWS